MLLFVSSCPWSSYSGDVGSHFISETVLWIMIILQRLSVNSFSVITPETSARSGSFFSDSSSWLPTTGWSRSSHVVLQEVEALGGNFLLLGHSEEIILRK